MQCFVYKSQRRDDTYVYLREESGFSALPAGLVDRLGTLIFVIELDLSPQRKLARENVTLVMENLLAKGYHLQLPAIAECDVTGLGPDDHGPTRQHPDE